MQIAIPLVTRLNLQGKPCLKQASLKKKMLDMSKHEKNRLYGVRVIRLKVTKLGCSDFFHCKDKSQRSFMLLFVWRAMQSKSRVFICPFPSAKSYKENRVGWTILNGLRDTSASNLLLDGWIASVSVSPAVKWDWELIILNPIDF